MKSSLFSINNNRTDRLAGTWWFIYVSKFCIFCVSFLRKVSSFCIYHWFNWRNFRLLYNPLLFTSPTQSCLVSYYFSASLHHSLITRLTLSSQSPHILQKKLSFCSLEFFTSALADGFSLESERQQVFSSLQDSFQDSGSSQQYCRLNSLYPSAKFQVLQAF